MFHLFTFTSHTYFPNPSQSFVLRILLLLLDNLFPFQQLFPHVFTSIFVLLLSSLFHHSCTNLILSLSLSLCVSRETTCAYLFNFYYLSFSFFIVLISIFLSLYASIATTSAYLLTSIFELLFSSFLVPIHLFLYPILSF